MSFVITDPAARATAGSHLNGVGSVLVAQNAAAAAATTELLPAAADEISALAATQFSIHAATYQTASEQAMAIHELFIAILDTSAGSHAATEAANTAAAR